MTFRRHATSAPARVALLLFPALACVLALGACQTTAPLNADTFTKDGFKPMGGAVFGYSF